MVELLKFSCPDLFQVTVLEPRCGISFLNWSFRSRKTVGGIGVYALFYKDALVYLGKFLGRQDAPFLGNIVGTRWWTHLASLTMRGRRLSVPRSIAIDTLNPRLRAALKNAPKDLYKDHGCASSKNRILFANKFWKDFESGDPALVLKDFSFVYARLTSNPYGSVDELRNRTSDIEQNLISKLHPPCNDQTTWGTAWPKLKQAEIGVCFNSAMLS